jgi:hypothetical protein
MSQVTRPDFDLEKELEKLRREGTPPKHAAPRDDAE